MPSANKPEHDLKQLLYAYSSALTYFDWTVILIYARGMNYIEMIYTEVIDMNATYNFVVENIFLF